MSIRSFKKEIRSILQGEAPEAALHTIAGYPAQRLLKPLFAELCNCDELLKWHAVDAMGRTVTRLAQAEMEDARVVMRRFMWMLNDESGGIGWGVPEAMAEVCACHRGLAGEYTHMLVSYMREEGFFLELPTLQRGLMWGLGRLAEVARELLLERQAPRYLRPYLQSVDSAVRGLAARAAGKLGDRGALPALQALHQDAQEVSLYRGWQLHAVTVGQLAAEAIRRIEAQD